MNERGPDPARETPGGSGKVFIAVGGALVLGAGLVLVAVWPSRERAASPVSVQASPEAPQETAATTASIAAARENLAVPSSPPSVAPTPVSPLPSKDFFATDAPEPLRKMHDVTGSGGLLAMERMKELYQMGKDHPGDARPHLLMAEDAMNRGWEAFAVSHYERAQKEDPLAKEDPRMLKDLVEVAGGKHEAAKAAAALSSIYGAQAVAAVEQASAAAGDKGDADRVEKLEALSRSLGAPSR